MRKIGALTILLITAGAVVAGGYTSSKISEQYQYEQLQTVGDLNQNLGPLNMHLLCNTHSQWFGIVLNETCTLERLDSPLVLLEVWHRVFITPLWLQGSFGVVPETGFILEFFDLAPLFQEQSGQWQLSVIKQQVNFTYKLGGLYSTSMPGTELSMSPITFSGYLDVNAPYKSQLSIQLTEFSADQPGQSLHLKNLHIQSNSAEVENQPFSESTRIELGSFNSEIQGDSLAVQELSISQTNSLTENKLASFNRIDLKNLSYSREEGSLVLNSNKLHFSFENLDWIALKQLSDRVELDVAPSPADFKNLLAKGMQFNLEGLESSFSDLDPEGIQVGPSGDVKLNGVANLAAVDEQAEPIPMDMRLKADFKLDLSDSLLVGPQAELIQDFIDQGWLQQQNNRLIANIRFADGQLLSNGQLVSGLAMFPESIE